MAIYVSFVRIWLATVGFQIDLPADVVTPIQDINESSSALVKDFAILQLINAVAILAIAWSISIGITKTNTWLSERVPRRFRLTIKQFLPFIRGLIFIVAALAIVQQFINLSSGNLFALTGTVSVALGFAFKDYASSAIAGLVGLFEAPYRVGDRVQIGDHYGEVVGYGLRSIRLLTPDDNLITIPHGQIWADPVSNANAGALEAMVVTDFYLAPSADIQAATQILYLAAYTSKYTQLKLPVVVVAEEHPWYTHLKLKSYPIDARDEFIYKTDLLLRAKQSFALKKLAYPQINMPNNL